MAEQLELIPKRDYVRKSTLEKKMNLHGVRVEDQ
jgi:hypothetical protein